MLSCLVLCFTVCFAVCFAAVMVFRRMYLCPCVCLVSPPGFCEALTRQLMDVGFTLTGTAMNDMRVIILTITEVFLRGY